MSEIDFSVQIIPDNFQIFRGNSSAPASEVMARILNKVSGDSGGKLNPNEYRVLIAYQILSPELSLEKLLEQVENDNPANPGSLGEIGMKTGYYVFFVKPTTTTTKLELNINGELYIVNRQELFIGRRDETKNILPDIDLTPFLRGIENKVSRKLIGFREIEGKWMVRLHPESQSTVFLDAEKLNRGEEREIGSTLNIGNSADEPYVRIKTRIISE